MRNQYNNNILLPCYFIKKPIKDFVINRLGLFVNKGTSVCDIGCGSQPFRNYIEERGGQYTGVDFVQNQQNSVHVIAPVHEIPMPDRHFDVILCTEVLEHVPDIHAAFKEMARLLKIGGYLIITTPFLYPLHLEPFDFCRLTPYQIQICAKNYNMTITEMVKSGNEIEVITTLIEEALSLRTGSVLSKIWNVFIRAIVNPPTFLVSRVASAYCKQKLFLNTLCIIRNTGD